MKLWRDPLLHFALLGAALLLVQGVVSDRLAPDAARRIDMGPEEIALLADEFGRRWRRPPTQEELDGIVRARVREEVLYREAVAMGMDENDAVVRRRMVQKMELLSQDLALLADPTDEELRSFFEENGDDYRVPPRISFTHVYFNVDRRGDAAEEGARRLLEELRRDAPSISDEAAVERGDRFLLQYDYSLSTPVEVGKLFGERFEEALFELDEGWHGPVVSGYGIHLVHVRQRVDGRLRELDEIRDRVVSDFNRARTRRANDAIFDKLAADYEIAIDDDALREAALPGGSGGRKEEP